MTYPTKRAIRAFQVGSLPVEVFGDEQALASAAAQDTAEILRSAYEERGEVNLIMATGNSQLAFYRALRVLPGLPWHRTRLFLVDQYTGVDEDELGTLAFLRRHLLAFVTPMEVYPVTSSPEDVEASCRAIESSLRAHPADLATIGWGENGHIAFNDPHNASFTERALVKSVELSQESRRQPVSEGRFPSIDAVPTHAITLTIPALLAARQLLCIVPEARKAAAVRACLEEPVSERRPGSVLRQVGNARLYLDSASAAALTI